MAVISTQEQYVTRRTSTYSAQYIDTLPQPVYSIDIYDWGDGFGDKRFRSHYHKNTLITSTYDRKTELLLQEIISRCTASSAESIIPDTLGIQKSLQIISEIETDDEDWNGNKVGLISKTIIEAARRIITGLVHQPAIFPTGRRTIHMEYNLADKSYLEFEIFENRITCMEVPKREYKKAKFRKLTLDDTELINHIVETFHADS